MLCVPLLGTLILNGQGAEKRLGQLAQAGGWGVPGVHSPGHLQRGAASRWVRLMVNRRPQSHGFQRSMCMGWGEWGGGGGREGLHHVPLGWRSKLVRLLLVVYLHPSSNFSCAGFIISITRVGKSRFIVIIEIEQ